MPLRCVYTDLDGTLLGRGASLFRDGGGRFTLLGARALEGYWLDVHRNFSFYVFVGETAELSRWISADLDFGIGFQGRYP